MPGRLRWLLVWTVIPLGVAGAVSFTIGQEQRLDDPLPLRRVMIPASKLPAELERIKPAVLVQMPREDFEALVQRAAKGSESTKTTPRLVRATYTAELDGQSLAGGGQW